MVLPGTPDMTREEWNLILQSLNFTEEAFRNYSLYPTDAFKRQRLNEVAAVKSKVRALRDWERR